MISLTYDDLIHLARLCFLQAQDASNLAIRAEFLRLAQGYQQRAAALNGQRARKPAENSDAIV
jgi:hypothetical protein